MRRAIEDHLGAELVEARREWNRLGYTVIAANGRSMFLGDRDAYNLMGDTCGAPIWRFAPQYRPSVYTAGYDQMMYYMTYQNQVYCYPQPQCNPTTNTNPKMQAPAPSKRPEPDARKLRKLFWHRYAKTGEKPLTS